MVLPVRLRSTWLAICITAVFLTACQGSTSSHAGKSTPVTIAPSATATTIPMTATTACAVPGQSDTTVTIPLANQGIVSQMMLSTNLGSVHELIPATDKIPLAATKILQEWNPPLVRLHMGFAYGDKSLPEFQQGNWDIQQLDDVIAQLRAKNITFYLSISSGPPWMYDANGQLRDQSFQEFARYAARLVGWYNKGGFTDEAGQYHASGHTDWIHYWEVWNEPNSGYEIPAPVKNPGATWMEGDAFARLWNVAVHAMRAIDPTIIAGGPTISSYPDIPYLQRFIGNVTEPLGFLSMHYYAIGNQQDSDATIFAAANGPRFIDRIIAAKQILAQDKPGQNIPIWIDEFGGNEIARGAPDPRGTATLAYAFTSQVFTMSEYQGIGLISQYTLIASPQLGLISNGTAQTFPIYYYHLLLSRLFAPGITLLPVQIANGSNIIAMAAIAPDHMSLRLLIGNLQVANASDNNGIGVARTVHLQLTGQLLDGATFDKSGVTWHYDATSPKNSVPTPCNSQITAANTVDVTVGGYGATIVSIPLHRP